MVVQGSALMRVCVVGEKSVYGGIAKELQSEDERDTPLKVKLGALAIGISKFGYIGGVVIALALLFQRIVIAQGFDTQAILAYCSQWTHLLNDIIRALMLAVIIIVMAVPEGLPLMIAIVSALNMGKMLKDNVLVRKISGIETAGSLNFLFSDKTGTITKGKLEVISFFNGVKDYSSFSEIEDGLEPFVTLSIFANSGAFLSGAGKERKAVGGNGTERALLNFAKESSAPPYDIQITEKILFNSQNKFSAAGIKLSQKLLGSGTLTLIKGAPEKIIPLCTCSIDAHGNKILFDSHEKINKKIDELAERSIRVVALAVSPQKIVNKSGTLNEMLPPDAQWVFAGIVGIRDELRPESVEAIAEVQSAGVRVVMITGDRKETAVSIAKEAGLLTQNDDITLNSDELSALSDDEVKTKLPHIKVIARALPSDKSRLVRIAQELGFVTGMTGDGVNDSPALKKADVGFAMGGGTEVAKEASEIVILDDNFSSIDKAILYGRTIFNSIRKFIVFQLTINVSAVIITFIAPLFGQPNPLSITQILWINLIMDTLAALAFGGESALRRFMREAPKRRDEAIVSPAMWSAIMTGALWIFALSFLYLFTPVFGGFFPPEQNGDVFRTGYFAFFVFCAVFNAFNARTEKINLLDAIGGNKGFLRIIVIIVVVQVLLIYLGREIFQCFGLNAAQWKIMLALAVTIIPVDMLRKALAMSKNTQTNFTSRWIEKRASKLLKRYEENNQGRG
jgi:calcium-translocating P-type ATPase